MKIASNASPLIFLIKLRKLDFLKEHELLVPSQVLDEIGKDKEERAILEEWLREHKGQVHTVKLLGNLPKTLGEGEQAALSLAVSEKADIVLVDERKARVAAELLGLVPKGTIAIIQQQLLNKKITRKEARNLLLELIRNGYRIREELIAEFLQETEKN